MGRTSHPVSVGPQRCTRQNQPQSHTASQKLWWAQLPILCARDTTVRTVGTGTSKVVTMERVPVPGTENTEYRYAAGQYSTLSFLKVIPDLPAGQQLKANDVVREAAKKWKTMDPEMKAIITDPLIEELVALREEADTKAKVTPVHVLNDVSATMTKITREVRPLEYDICYVLTYLSSSWMHFTPVWALKPSSLVCNQAAITTRHPWSMPPARRYPRSLTTSSRSLLPT